MGFRPGAGREQRPGPQGDSLHRALEDAGQPAPLGRLFVRRRHMLEWVTAAQAKFSLPLDIPGFYRRMAGGVALAVAAATVVAYAGSGAWPIAVPFVILWTLAPVIAQWASRPPPVAGANPVTAADAHALRLIARRTWGFFETFVTADDHMLP